MENNNITTEDLFFKDCFTEVDGKINEEINKLTVKCFNSTNNTFSMDCDGNLSVNSITTKQNTNLNSKFNYPIGSLYWNKNDITEYINSNFEGTWVRVKDTFIAAAGERWQAGTSIGEYEHTITEAEMPRHRHFASFTNTSAEVGNTHYHNYGEGIAFGISDVPAYKRDTMFYFTGESSPMSMIPKAKVYYCWERIS